MTFWDVWRSLYKENLWGGWQSAIRTTAWNPDWQSYRFCKHWAAGNHSAICIWGKTRRKAIWTHWLWSCNWRRIMQWHFQSYWKVSFQYQRLTISGNRLSNKLGRNRGCSVLLQDKAPLAAFNYCANHDLNLVLGKCSNVPKIYVIFFKYSPKRCRRFEDCVERYNTTLPKNKKVTKRSLRCFVKHNGWM